MKFIDYFKPPQNWKLPIIIALGVLMGIVANLIYSSKAHSYLSDKPETCINCHIMGVQYASWKHSSHKNVTNCNDCHVPHNNMFNKYFFKAKDGLRHATMFTFRLEPQVIVIHEAGINVVQSNCIRCHKDLISNDRTNSKLTSYVNHSDKRICWECHREVPHGRVNSLSSIINMKVFPSEKNTSSEIEKLIKNK